ncbi:hypothetical protein HWB92_gp167 [Serratia phage vB_SmaA_3M]|uniref:Uncharacterized protein n=1 Tax=Serratia phage vB_SmaA_3M TaxID=2419930 RepID=A0A3G2YSZ3_9CAUD|nr:hypothetical protein HWB92_gp167 [Serratia phage vB_SmaA_3M]AYP28425.1 hypothetical protein 3M_169 [Serratia phage vB_SmaA_3M]
MIDITDYVLFLIQSMPWLCLVAVVFCSCMAILKNIRRQRILKQGLKQIERSEMEENTQAIIAANRHFLQAGEDLTSGVPDGTLETVERILGRK